MLKTRIKAFFAVLIATLTASIFLYARPANAAISYTDYLLQLILTYTKIIADKVNDLPTYISTFYQFSMAWLDKDTSDTTKTLQANFTNYVTASMKNDETQLSDQPQFMKDYIATITYPLSYMNQIYFGTLLGAPFSSDPEKDENGKEVNSAYSYIKNASGLNITHIPPSDAWRGTPDNKNRYLNYYKTISAVQSFNIYALSALYADSQNGFTMTKTQKALYDQASKSDFFVEIAQEKIGTVLRQILMFNSQTYVLLIKLLEIQKQQLAGQAMTNTLMIMGNQFTENDMVTKAIGTGSAQQLPI